MPSPESNATPPTKKPTVWNVPNQLSMARLFLSIVVFVLIPLQWYWAAFVGFVIAAGTDWIDGWWARKFNQVTQLGRILDPFCDKFLICGSFILLAVAMTDFPWYASVAGWMAVVIVSREMLVTALRSFIEQSGGDFSAKMAGKLKMWFQCIAVGASLVALALRQADPAADLPSWLTVTLTSSIWIAILSTLYSGYQYVVASFSKLTLPE